MTMNSHGESNAPEKVTADERELLSYGTAAMLLQVRMPRIKPMVWAGRLDHAGRGYTTRSSVNRELTRRADMIARGEWVTVAEAAQQLKVSEGKVRGAARRQVLDEPTPGMITTASVDAVLAERASKQTIARGS